VVDDGGQGAAVGVAERGEQLVADRRPAPQLPRLEADVLDAEVAGQAPGPEPQLQEAVGDLRVIRSSRLG